MGMIDDACTIATRKIEIQRYSEDSEDSEDPDDVTY